MVKINNTSNCRFGFSEADMAIAFETFLRSKKRLPKIGSFDKIYREISCCIGRPDFIALRNMSDQETVPFLCVDGLVGPSILSILKPIAPRTLDFVVSRSEFSRNAIRKSLRRLLETGHVEQTESGAYRHGKASTGIDIEIWSFELKLINAKRAVFQAQQSRVFADRSLIVIPPGQEGNYKKYHETMKRWGIGLATFDPKTNEFRLARKGRKSKPFSRTHQIYALSRISA